MKVKPSIKKNPFSDFAVRDVERQRSLFEKTGIPLTPEGTAPINNHLARSPLFAPIKRGRRPHHKGIVLTSQGDAEIKYYGEQLDMSDQNVLFQAYRLAAGVIPEDDTEAALANPKSRIVINRAQFLKAIHLTASGASYKWLHDSLIRLASAIIEIDTKDYSATYQLLGPPQLDKTTNSYFFHIPKSTFAFFVNSSFGLVNLERRFSLEVRQDLGWWIQTYTVSHSKTEIHSKSLKHLQALCGQTRPMRHFRVAFKEAVEELAKKGEFEFWEITTDDFFRFKRSNQD